MRAMHAIQDQISIELNALGIPDRYTKGDAYKNYIGRLATSMASLCKTSETSPGSGLFMCQLNTPFLCDPEEVASSCVPVVEIGWHPYAAYSMFFRMLAVAKEVAETEYRDIPHIVNIIQQEMKTLARTITLHQQFYLIMQSPSIITWSEFYRFLWDQIPTRGESLLLNIGAVDHAIYLEFRRDVATTIVHVTLFNLGALALREDNRKVSAKTVVLDSIKKRAQIEKILHQITNLQRQKKRIDSREMRCAFSQLYALSDVSSAVQDFPQLTDNCVWRGYAFYLKNICMRAGIEERELMNSLFGAICHMLREVDLDENRAAYNILQMAIGVTRDSADATYAGLETCAGLEEWVGPVDYHEIPGVGCETERLVTASTKPSAHADLTIFRRPKRGSATRAGFSEALGREEKVRGEDRACGGYVDVAHSTLQTELVCYGTDEMSLGVEEPPRKNTCCIL